jgi:chromosome segregation ATPase
MKIVGARWLTKSHVSLGEPQTRLDVLQSQLDSAKQQLQKWQQDYQRLINSNASLKSQMAELTREYEQKLSALKKGY